MPYRRPQSEDGMRRCKRIGAALCAGVLAVWGGRADAEEFSARLDGFQELGSLPNVTQDSKTLVVTAANPTGAILSNGKGTLALKLDEEAHPPTATWTLTYPTFPRFPRVLRP